MKTSLTPEQVSEIERYWKSSLNDLAWMLASPEDRAEASREVDDFQTGRGWEGTQRYPVPLGEEGRWVQEAITNKGRAAAERFARANKDLLCDKFDYCNKRDALKDEGPVLAISVADCLIIASTGIPIPFTALSVYLVKRGILDKICDCNAR